MKLPKEIEKLLLPVARPSNWVPDEYDVGVRDIMVDWQEAESVDAGIVGVPFDTAVMGRRGCRFGPESVRSALVFSNVYDPSVDVDLSIGLSLTDFGNIDVLQTEVLGTHERIENVITAIYGLDLSIAPGTCSPNPGGLTAYESLELVWQIGKHPLSRGMDLVEIAPSLDQGGVTSIMGVALIMHYLGATKVSLEKERNG